MPRQKRHHLARAVSAEATVYILHSQKCSDSNIDLRECEFSIALEQGINLDMWTGFEDRPVVVSILNGHLIPLRGAEGAQRG